MPTRKTGMVVAKDACVVVVGARPVEYKRIKVTHNKTGELVEMNGDQILDEGSDGIPYAFKPYQRVYKDHPAVKAAPGAFTPIEDLEEAEQDLVVT